MGSNQNLKAYVRYDGSNRVVAGSLIFRRKKPKVGKWHEIAISECCEYIPPTTTTTSTSSTSTTTSTSTSTTTSTSTSTSTTSTTTTVALFSGIVVGGTNGGNSCSGSPYFGNISVTGNGTTFCNSTAIVGGDFVYYPIGTNYVSYEGQYYSISNNGTNVATITGVCTTC